MGSKASSRTQKTGTATLSVTSGIFKVKRFNITTSANSLTVPAEVAGIIVRNDGPNDVAIREVGANASDYYTVKVGDPAIELPITDGVSIEAQTGSGTAKLECIFWG